MFWAIRTWASKFLICLLFCAAVALCWNSAAAQTTTAGTVVGQITDQSGAVVPGATVTLTDLATKSAITTTTNEAGRYLFINVNPGSYKISIHKTGFAETVVSNQQVKIGTTATLNLQMKIGAADETVDVEASNTELQTLNATVGNTITGVAIDSLPTIGHDVSTFVTLQPGVAPGGQVAGTVVDQSSFALDGGNNTSDMDGSMQVYTPSFGGDPTALGFSPPTGVVPAPADSVEEFKVNSAGQTADFNSSSGADVKVATKRGTDTFHGTIYEYYEDNNFSANTWQNNLSHTPVPDWHRNWFGVAGGGPIIPKKILGGKTYLFANYQGSRWPNSTTIERSVPSDNMRNGILNFNGTNYDMKAADPRGVGINPVVQTLWTKYMPAGNDPSCGALLGVRCDGVNTIGFKANMAVKQNDNFGVVRLDHDFSEKWHFMASYRYYHLVRATADQYDIGGFFTGDKLGVPASTSSRPQVPSYLVAGMTTQVTTNLTNDFHFSYLRNYWAWQTQQAPPQVSGSAGALEPFGEFQTTSLVPYNVNTQQARTRFWDGHDYYYRDDLSLLKGSHLLQFGGSYERNWDYHQRTDNGGGIFYNLVYQLGDSSGPGLINLSDLVGIPANVATDVNFGREAAAVYGMVTDSQIAYTRSGPNLTLNPPNTPASDKSTIPYYSFYFNDAWHMKPTFSMTFGLSYALEMPPIEQDGKEVAMTDSSGQQLDILSYLAQIKAAALKGQVYNPTIGFALLSNTGKGLKYPYNPFYRGFSPRFAVAWNPKFSDGILGKLMGDGSTVVRAGYGRIYGRLNGVDQVLVPLLGDGLIQAVQCRQALASGTCGPATPTATTAFRIGVDGNTAPIAQATTTLPQPIYPGFNNVNVASGAALDPGFRPNSVDSINVSIQRQLNNKMTVEVGYIGRWIHNEFQPITTNMVPYMMTLGGQTFAQAYAAVETAMGCTSSEAQCLASVKPANFNPASVAAQPFFEAALAGTGYCTGYANCTTAIVTKQISNFANQKVWTMWSALDKGGIGGGPNGTTLPGWNFARSMPNSAIYSSPFGSAGQISGGVSAEASIGYGNYNAGYVSLKMNGWKGMTSQSNFTWSKALGTGAFTQSSSSYQVDDPWNLGAMYGRQSYDRHYVYTQFIVYNPPFFKGQQGFLGHVLGGWSIAPVFAAGSGAPIYCNTPTDAQSFGAADGVNNSNNEQCIGTGAVPSVTRHNGVTGSNGVGTKGIVNIFADPAAVYNSFRDPILGIDTKDAGVGYLSGLPYWNLDLGMRKNIRMTERFSTEASVTFINVLNHNQMSTPSLSITSPTTWGVESSQANTPRTMEFGIRLNF